MRPTFTLRSPRAEGPSLWPLAALVVIPGLVAGGPALACMSLPDDSAQVSLELSPKVSAEIHVSVYEQEATDDEPATRSCYASTMMPLSAFTSVSTRLGTDAVARAVAESVRALALENCEITLYYSTEDSTELTEQEACVEASFGFSSGDLWETEREHPCMSDEEIAARDAFFREFEEAEAQRLAEREAAEAAGLDPTQDLEVVTFELAY